MAEVANGEQKPDVEMNEAGSELLIDPALDAPPPPVPAPEPRAAEGAEHQSAATNGFIPQLDAGMPPAPPQATQAPPTTQASVPAQIPVAEAPPVLPLPATTAPIQAPPIVQPQAPMSAPTPPAVRESSRPSSMPPGGAGIAPPERPNAHGSPTRVYLNQNVTPHLLEGMKYLAAYEPEKPLKWLSEFLAKRSAETEGEL